jgi:hypothetical protein
MAISTSARSFGSVSVIHWTTLEKILSHSSPQGYQLSEPRPEPKIGPFKERIDQILEQDKAAPRKQRRSAKRIFERIRKLWARPSGKIPGTTQGLFF